MSQSTLKHRKAAAAAAPVTDYVPIEALSSDELYAPQGGRVPGSKATRVWWLMNLEGKHHHQSWNVRLYNFLMEIIGVFVLGLVVTLGTFVAGPSVGIANGLALAAAVAGTYLVMARLYSDYPLRRHLNPAFTLGYLFTGDVGILGLVYYWIAQVLGALFSGLVVGAILSEQDGGCANAGACPAGLLRATVPLPTTVNSATFGLGISQATVICLEIFIPMLITLVLLLKEHLNTHSHKSNKKPDLYSLQNNYKHAVKCAALATFVFVAVGHSFQVQSFNGATYLAGLFSGITASDGTAFGRTLYQLTRLSGTTFLTNSVFGPDGSAAWALYFFGPLAGAVAAGLVATVIMYIGFKNNTVAKDAQDLVRRLGGKPYDSFSEMPAIAQDASTPLLVAAQTTHTAVSDLVNPYSVNSGIASSVLGK
jgi:glycerol uptake facilitator-like aquaporin